MAQKKGDGRRPYLLEILHIGVEVDLAGELSGSHRNERETKSRFIGMLRHKPPVGILRKHRSETTLLTVGYIECELDACMRRALLSDPKRNPVDRKNGFNFIPIAFPEKSQLFHIQRTVAERRVVDEISKTIRISLAQSVPPAEMQCIKLVCAPHGEEKKSAEGNEAYSREDGGEHAERRWPDDLLWNEPECHKENSEHKCTLHET